jgi:uncharacterized protein YjiS (DUF1127 family)
MFSNAGVAALTAIRQIKTKTRFINFAAANMKASSQTTAPGKRGDDKCPPIKRSTVLAGIYANLRSGNFMKNAGLFMELLTTYRKHGWQLRDVLLQPAARSELEAQDAGLLKDIAVREAEVDALWFSRPSHQGREAWELRLLAQTPYALFETFEPDETEEERDDVKREMEARMRDYASSK